MGKHIFLILLLYFLVFFSEIWRQQRQLGYSAFKATPINVSTDCSEHFKNIEKVPSFTNWVTCLSLIPYDFQWVKVMRKTAFFNCLIIDIRICQHLNWKSACAKIHIVWKILYQYSIWLHSMSVTSILSAPAVIFK